jgi:DNA invertase Pin-like site-specific DNA recombinase
MSIDGQLSEMKAMAKKEKLFVAEVITESHSAKQSGQRPEFNRLLQGLSEGRFNSYLHGRQTDYLVTQETLAILLTLWTKENCKPFEHILNHFLTILMKNFSS